MPSWSKQGGCVCTGGFVRGCPVPAPRDLSPCAVERVRMSTGSKSQRLPKAVPCLAVPSSTKGIKAQVVQVGALVRVVRD